MGLHPIPLPLPLLLLLLPCISPGCRLVLDIPSDVRALDGGDGASGMIDAAIDPDIDAGMCRDGSDIGFDKTEDFAGWTFDQDLSACAVELAQAQLRVSQVGPPGRCRALRDLVAPMVDYGLRLRVSVTGNTDMSLVYSVILAGPGDLRSRRRIRIERDDGLIRLGECRGDGDCRPDMYGSFPIDAEQQVWWGIVHDGATSSIYFEFGTDGEVFSQPPQQTHVPNITRDMVECVGIELGTDETGSDTGISAFDDIANGRG